jgi:hypothetical protein
LWPRDRYWIGLCCHVQRNARGKRLTGHRDRPTYERR